MMASLSSKTLLVIDPSPETQALAREQAKGRCLSVVVAPDPSEAIALLDMGIPDVVLSDLRLTERNGFSMIRHIRRRCAHVSLIGMVEEGSEKAMLEAFRDGANDFLYKPVIGEQLGLALDRALELTSPTVGDVPGIEQVEYRLVIGPDPAYVEPCVSWLIAETARPLPEIRRLHVRAVLIELIVNAVEHGSLGIYYDEKHDALSKDHYDALVARRRRDPRFAQRRVVVHVSCDRAARRTRYTITDEGAGFDWGTYLAPSDISCDRRGANGRCVFLAKSFFPDLTYNDRGTEVTFSIAFP